MGRKQTFKKEEIFAIREIYHPPAPIQPQVDIVAVHGLNGSALGTWTTLDSGICWLNDPRFLPKYVKNARVLVWGYNASFSSLTGHVPSKDRIHHHAHTLVAHLAADRLLSGTADKPIIFLCHSLGGIVVKRVRPPSLLPATLTTPIPNQHPLNQTQPMTKPTPNHPPTPTQALTYAQTRTAHKVTHEHAIFTHTHSILFFGTPHHGTPKATWLRLLQRLGAAASLGKRSRPSALVAALEHESETLQNTADFFAPLAARFRVFYFYELHPTTVLPGWFGRGAARADYVIPVSSAVPAGHDEAERAGIAADHRGMVRFGDPGEVGFRVVVDALVRYCAEAEEVVRLRPAEVEEMGVERVERERGVVEGLRSGGGGGGGNINQLGAAAPNLSLRGVDLEIEDRMSRTTTVRSLSAPDEVKDENW
ncbi:hypothetical protein F5144DRAFT_400836 [Chaetomium tenue]|uniref:Uncharacterized protein n=1 Tax=Chaetomium tenue TaxID=1854479 RepID=A0ACB7NVN7_9PEZI|nr:hypothetical protein F5144DRAFT_400836 [Chaetomium globosum]